MDLPDRNVQIGQLRNDPRSLSSTYSCSQAANALALVDTLLRKKEASEHIDPGMEMQYLADIRSCLVDVVQRLNDGETILKQGREEEIPYDGPENNVQSQKCLSESMKLLSELNRNLESIATKMEKEELAKEAMNKKRGIKGFKACWEGRTTGVLCTTDCAAVSKWVHVEYLIALTL